MEKLTVKICLNGVELCEMDMGEPSHDHDVGIKGDFVWYTSGHVAPGNPVLGTFRPYFASLSFRRPDNKVVNASMEVLIKRLA